MTKHPLQDAILMVMRDGGWWTAPSLAAAVDLPPGGRCYQCLGGLIARGYVVRREVDGYGYGTARGRWEYRRA